MTYCGTLYFPEKSDTSSMSDPAGISLPNLHIYAVRNRSLDVHFRATHVAWISASMRSSQVEIESAIRTFEKPVDEDEHVVTPRAKHVSSPRIFRRKTESKRLVRR